MPTSRRYGGTRRISCPAISIEPSSWVTNPAIIRRVVVLPEPDGPSSVMNSPRRTSRSMPSTAGTVAEQLAQAAERECRRTRAAGRAAAGSAASGAAFEAASGVLIS